MKLVLHELKAARDRIRADDLRPAFKMLARVAAIQTQLIQSWSVLSTMTPADYLKFRDKLGQASGFQSHQYRLIEYMLGNRNTAMMKMHRHIPETTKLLQDELARPSLYHVALNALSARTGIDFDPSVFRLDEPHQRDEAIEAAWSIVYREPGKHWVFYELAEKLVDLEDYFRRWRFNHVTTVERIIGIKRGIGGTSGVKYLRRMLEVELFPELWHVRGGL